MAAEAEPWTEDRIAAALAGYLEVPRESYDAVKYGAHVRYVARGKGFRPGGFVKTNPFDVKPRGEEAEKRFLRLQNGFNEKAATYAQWLVAYEDLETLYVKADAQTAILIGMIEEAIRGLNLNIRRVADRLVELEARVAELEPRRPGAPR